MKTNTDNSEAIVHCPYCDDEIILPFPEGPGLPQCGSPYEIQCTPYTRDVGRFDPRSEDLWFDKKGWSRIGKDFLPWLNWEKIGILRINQKGINVQYRVQVCPSCKSFFDVYLNYTTNKNLESLWPHLFAPHPKFARGIRKYFGESLPIWLVRRVGNIVKSNIVGATLLGALLFTFVTLPSFLLRGMQSSYMLYNGNIYIYFLASILFIITLIIEERFISYFETTDDFEKLLIIFDKQRGLTHWRNFNLCRFVGVQNSRNFPNLSQMDYIAGGLSEVLLISTWFTRNLERGLFFISIIGFIISGLIFLYGYRNRKKLESANPYVNLGFALLGLILLGTSIFVAYKWFNQPMQNRLDSLLYTFDLMFWIVIAYIIGTAFWFALSIVSYVLKGLSCIPMKISPYDNFIRSRPLRILQTYSTGILLLLFITIIIIVAILEITVQADWLLNWMQWGHAFLFAAIGFGLGRGEYVGIAFVYTVITLIVPDIYFINGKVLTLGIFFTFLIGFQILSAEQIINDLLTKAKNDVLSKLERQVDDLTAKLVLISKEEQINHPEEVNIHIELSSHRQTILQSIESLLKMIDLVVHVPTTSKLIPRLSEIISPLITSLFLPSMLEYMIKLFLH
jgi:hypothetical protein